MCRVALVLSVAVFTASCVALPIAESTRGTSRVREEAAAVTIRPGVTTREEVLLALGEPDAVMAASVFVYTGRTWWRWRGLFLYPNPITLVFPMPFAGGEEGVSVVSLRIEFDERGVVTHVERKPD